MTFLVNVLLTTLFCIGLNDPGKNPGTYQDYVLQLLQSILVVQPTNQLLMNR